MIHDHFCTTESRSWRAVHRVFYDAMIESGVGMIQASAMYYAVYRYGPRWADERVKFTDCLTKWGSEEMDANEVTKRGMCFSEIPYDVRLKWQPLVDEERAKESLSKIKSVDLTLEDLEKMADDEILEDVSFQEFIDGLQSAESPPADDGRVAAFRELGLIK